MPLFAKSLFAKPPYAKRCAFSLIELIIVLVLLAVLASMAAFSTRGAAARSRLARGVEAVEQFDLALRRAARDSRTSVSGTIDRGTGELGINTGGAPRSFQVPDRVRIRAVRFRSSNNTPGRVLASGDGATATYSVELECDGARAWLLFAGGTGQVVRCDDRAHASRLLGAAR